MKQMTTLAIATLLTIGLSAAPAFAGHHKNPCNPCAANPCAMKHNPCEMKKNPCDMGKKNPCDMKSHNPCNPCAMKDHGKH